MNKFISFTLCLLHNFKLIMLLNVNYMKVLMLYLYAQPQESINKSDHKSIAL